MDLAPLSSNDGFRVRSKRPESAFYFGKCGGDIFSGSRLARRRFRSILRLFSTSCCRVSLRMGSERLRVEFEESKNATDRKHESRAEISRHIACIYVARCICFLGHSEKTSKKQILIQTGLRSARRIGDFHVGVCLKFRFFRASPSPISRLAVDR